nr:metalloregulator ArsR/SmtB family transcription factor [uncultured Rhodopila sp.]
MIGRACDHRAAADLLRALAHPMRLQILCRLLDGEASVATLESELGLKQPNLSQQLGQLREARLVATRREAKSIVYSLSDGRVRAVLDAVAAATHETPIAPVRTALARPAAGVPAAARRATGSAECSVFAVAGWP